MDSCRAELGPVPNRHLRMTAHRLLFVYGTLRREAPGNPRHLLDSDAAYVDTGTSQGKLYDLGAYPGLIASSNPNDRVVGEIYKLRAPRLLLPRLDAYEGRSYHRVVGKVETQRGEHLQAWVYVYGGPRTGRSRIASGDYLAHLQRNPSSRRAASRVSLS